MDSWWATRNPKQGPKWAHNIAQNWSGAYGPEPCRIWVPKLPKSVFYIGWLDEPAEPDANRSKKIWKFDRMFLEEWGIHEKKWCAILSSKKRDMIKIITKNQCSTSADSMNRLNRLPTIRPVAKNFENFTECSWKNKESKKETVLDSEFGWGRYDQNKPECSEPQHAPINLITTQNMLFCSL